MLYNAFNNPVPKGDLSSYKGNAGGCAPPDLRQGPEDPGPANGDIALLEKADKLRPPRLGYGKFEGFWPMKHNGTKSDFRVPPSLSESQADFLLQA